MSGTSWSFADSKATGPAQMSLDEAVQHWNRVREQRADRARRLPDEQAAIAALLDAYERLLELGWRDIVYCKKDGSRSDVIEAGSHTIFPCRYLGPDTPGSWMIEADGDLYPGRPILFRAEPST